MPGFQRAVGLAEGAHMAKRTALPVTSSRFHTRTLQFVFRSRDDLILQFSRKIAKVVAVAGHTYDQVAVSVGL